MNLNGNSAAAPASPLGIMTPGIGFALAPVQDTGNAPVQAAYGGIRLSLPFNIGALSTTWVKIAGTWLPIVTPLNVVQDVANQGIRVGIAGVYLVSIRVEATFTASSAASTRSLKLRAFDETDNVAIGGDATLTVVKDQDSAATSVTVMVDVTPSAIGKLLVLQVSSDVAFAALVITAATLSAARVSIN